MARTLQYESARKDYHRVKYFPFPVPPGEPYMLTSNPWNFLKTWLNNEIRKFNRTSPRKKRLEKSLYFLELAENFQNAADYAKLPTKGTFSYYSILNLIKVFLLTSGEDLETTIEHHGLSLPPNETKKLKISSIGNDGINIFATFAKKVGCTVVPGNFIKIDEMTSELPEIHEMTFNIGKLTTKKRKFLPVEIEILTNTPRHTHLVYELKYEKKNSNLMQVSKFNSGILNSKLQKIGDDGRWITYRSKNRVNYTKSSENSWYARYNLIRQELTDIGVSVILTRSGYRYYLNLQPNKYKPITYYVALMYYIGSVARYRPTVYNDILTGEYQAVLNETMETCPRQFLYYISSLITKKVCAVPMAKLN
jgi:hypothetical protein